MKELIEKLGKAKLCNIVNGENEYILTLKGGEIVSLVRAIKQKEETNAEGKKEFNADFLYDEIFNILNANRDNFTEPNSILKSRIILKYAKDIHNAVMSYKLKPNADELKRHAIGFLKYYNGGFPMDGHFERAYTEYLNTLTTKEDER